MTNQASGNAYQYDALGRVTLVHQHVGTATADQHYGYTPIGQLASMQYPSDAIMQYGYTSDGKVASMTVGGVTLLDQLQYQADGKIGQWTWGNGRSATRTFDADGRLNQYSKANSTGLITYDTVNRIVNLADSSGSLLTQNFGYDNNDRLTTYNAYATTQSNQYDADGNRTAQANGAATRYAVLHSCRSSGHAPSGHAQCDQCGGLGVVWGAVRHQRTG